MNLKSMSIALAVGACCATGFNAHAQDLAKIAPGSEIAKGEAKVQGLNPSLSVNGNLSLTQSDKVVGQLDGVAVLVGLGALGELDWTRDEHEVTNRLTLTEAFSRTPALDRFIKNNDLATLESAYTYYMLEWLGAYVRAKLSTSILPTNDVRGSATTFAIARLDGSVETRNDITSLRLADPFQPFTIDESFGAVAKALDNELAKITFRLGAGGRETFSKGVLILADDKSTPDAVEARESDNVYQAGFELVGTLGGKVSEHKITYALEAGLLLPPINNDPRDRSAIDLMRKTVTAGASYGMLDWLALTYQFRLVDDPQLQEDVQIQNSLLLTLQYTLVKKAAIEKEDPLKKAQAEAKAAIDRATVLEQELETSRAREAELEGKLKESDTVTPPAELDTPSATPPTDAEPVPAPQPTEGETTTQPPTP